MRTILLASTAVVVCLAAQARACTMPAGAALAGYNTLTFGPTIQVDGNWFRDTGDGTANVTTNSDGSVTIAGGGDTWNGQLLTHQTFSNGFYTEATISVPGQTYQLSSWTGGSSGSQWPSFWSYTTVDNPAHIELDFMEMMNGSAGNYGATIHNWSTNPQTWYGQQINSPTGELNAVHRYGALWVPATASQGGQVTFFFDGQAMGTPITWTAADFGTYGIAADQALVLRLGAGANSPMRVYQVEVWQAGAGSSAASCTPDVPALPAALSATATPQPGPNQSATPTAQTQTGAAIAATSLTGYAAETGTPNDSATHALLAEALAAAAAQTPTTPGAAFPAPAAAPGAPSADGTVVTEQGGGSLTDAAGNVWAINAAGVITINGRADPTTDNVTKITEVKGVVWQQNAAGLWWYKTSPTAFWETLGGSTTGPLTTAPTSAQIQANATASDQALQQAVTALKNNTALTPMQQAAIDALQNRPEGSGGAR